MENPQRIPGSLDRMYLKDIAKAYLDAVQNKVAAGSRIRHLDELALYRANMADLVITKKKNGDELREYKLRPEFTAKDAEKFLDEDLRGSYGYKVVAANYQTYVDETERLKKEARSIFEATELWLWCERTKGLGEVAAMTFLGYIDPDRCVSAGNFFSWIGLHKGIGVRKGQRYSYNRVIKGRTYVILQNIMLHQDPYYIGTKEVPGLYNIKKMYLHQRPDLAKLKADKARFKFLKQTIDYAEMTELYIAELAEKVKLMEVDKNDPNLKVETTHIIKKPGITRKQIDKALETLRQDPAYIDWMKEHDELMVRESTFKGIDGHINNKAKRFVWKILISNAIEIIRTELGMEYPHHREYLPPKPKDESNIKPILDAFTRSTQRCLIEENKRITEDGQTPEQSIEQVLGPVRITAESAAEIVKERKQKRDAEEEEEDEEEE